MTHRNQDIELVEILQATCADGDDPLRALLAHTLQRVLEEEITAFLNAETYERKDKRKGYRNGYKPRTLKMQVGRIELMVPKDREGLVSALAIETNEEWMARRYLKMNRKEVSAQSTTDDLAA